MSGKSVKELIRAGDGANRERRWVAAEKAYADALDLAPGLSAIWVQYGHSLKEQALTGKSIRKQGLFREAESAYRRALALDENVADSHLQLGHILKLQGRIDSAISAYQACYALDPRSHDAIRELAALGTTVAAPGKKGGHLRRERETRRPPDVRPDIATTRADSSDIKALYLLLLGRLPEKLEALNESRGRPIVEVTRDLLRSNEFHRLMLVPLMMGRGTRHDRLGQAELEFARAWFDRLAGAHDDSPLGWTELLRKFLGREPLGGVFSDAVLAALERQFGPPNGTTSIGKLFGPEGISVQLRRDHKATAEFMVAGAPRPQGDGRDEISRLHFAIPVEQVETYNGSNHAIAVRDERTKLPVPPERFEARLVPLFEGVIIGSCVRLSGWVRRMPSSDHRVAVDLRDGKQVLCSTVADRPTANPLAGDQGFELALPGVVPATAEICLDGIPISLLTDDVAVGVSRDSWKLDLGRSNVIVSDETAVEHAPLPIGFTVDAIAEGVRRFGPTYVLDGIDALVAHGQDPEPAIAGLLQYVGISRDYTFFSLIKNRLAGPITRRPRLLERAIMLYLTAGDVVGARQLTAMGRMNREVTMSLDLASAMLDFCIRQEERCREHAGTDLFSPQLCHRDALNSTYNTLLIAIGRQRLIIESLLRRLEAKKTENGR